MKEFKKGEYIKLAVIGKVEVNDKYFIYLSDGFKHTYRVSAYDFQAEWEESLLPDFINCYVADVDYRGLPYLLQSKKEVLDACYPSPDYYPFKLLAINKDEKTQALFYSLKDPYGIYHRLYVSGTTPEKEVGDLFSLWVNGIEEKEKNQAFLQLSFKDDKTSEVNNEEAQSNIDGNNIDPRTESVFGFEGNNIEFKSSIVFPAGGIEPNIDKQMEIIAKTIAGFQNAEGGKLYIGVNDSGNVSGIEHDYPFLNSSEIDNYTYQANKDGYENKIRTSIKSLLNGIANSKVQISFEQHEECEYCIVDIQKSDYPIYMHGIKLFQRTGNMTQLLKNDEISYFIETRLSLRSGNSLNVRNIELNENTSENQPVKVIEKPLADEKHEIEIKEAEPIDYSDVWLYVNLFTNGDWSYTRKKEPDEDKEKIVPIPKSLKKGFLVMTYDNGRVNIVSIQDLISPKGTKGKRKTRPEGRAYKTGWHTDAKFIHVFVAKPNDMLAFKSTTDDGKEWVKVHHLSDISVHDINAQGNVLINERFGDAEINYCNRLPLECYPHISGLVLKGHQTSQSLGFATTNKDFFRPIKLLFKLLKD